MNIFDFVQLGQGFTNRTNRMRQSQDFISGQKGQIPDFQVIFKDDLPNQHPTKTVNRVYP